MTGISLSKSRSDCANIDSKAAPANTGMPIVAFQDDQEVEILYNILLSEARDSFGDAHPLTSLVMND
jgi:hypothetical protein